MLLIFTNSIDTTTDLLLDRLKDVPVFRLNVDLWREYSWQFGPDGFSIKDPTGRCCDSASTALVYQRKPFFPEFIDVPAGGCLESWCREEALAAFRDIFYDYAARGRACLVHPGHGKWGKLRQLWLAQNHFRVPEWRAFHGVPCSIPGGQPAISKTLTQTPIGKGKFFFTKEANPAQLDPAYPWFIQNKVEAETDVTVVYLREDLFAFELDRTLFEGMDCRADLGSAKKWRPSTLSKEEQATIRAFMGATGLSFGRLDFLRAKGELIFLELNPNGQWAWLDEEGRHGLLSRIADEIRREYLRFASCTVPANSPKIV